MNKKIKSIIIILVVIFLAMVSVLPLFAANPPYTDEAYWNKTCAGIGYNNNKKDCEEYKSFLDKKVADDKNALKDLKYNLTDIKANSKKYEAEAKSYQTKVESLQTEVKSIEAGIAMTERTISKLELQIREREYNIAEKEEKIKNYIAASQVQSRVNGYIDFMMSATSFSDIIVRFEGLNRIKSYNEDLIKQLTEERVALQEDIEATEENKIALENSKKLLVTQVANTENMVAQANALFSEYDKLAAQLEAEAAKLNEKVALTEKQKDEIKEFFPPAPPPPADGGVIPPVTPPTTSNGAWTHPLSGSSYTLGSWGFKYRGSYNTGGFHTGADYTTGRVRAPLKMPGDGIVVISNDNNCPDGSIGSTCGNGWGNYVSMLVLVDGYVYGVSMAHLTAGSLTKGLVGKPIKAGTVLGRVGTSGISTGIHLHIEIYKTGYTDISTAFNAWSGDRYFGASSRYCHSNGDKAPCKVDAPLLFGDKTLTPGYYN